MSDEKKEPKRTGVNGSMLKAWFVQTGKIVGSGLLEEHEKEALTEISARIKEAFIKQIAGEL